MKLVTGDILIPVTIGNTFLQKYELAISLYCNNRIILDV